jgi:hypothetical protein
MISPAFDCSQLEAQHAARTAGDALTAGDAVAVNHRLALPGETSYVNPDWAVI